MGHESVTNTKHLFGLRWLLPHRVILIALLCALVISLVVKLDWSWIAEYREAILSAIWKTVLLLVSTFVVGFILAIPIGLVQVTGPKCLSMAAHTFCSMIRGTPLLLQIWIFYYGFGSIFPELEGIRESFVWPLLTSAWPYAFFALTLSVMAYEGEVLRGAFSGVPKGELEAAKAMGMKPFKVLTRIWLPRAIQRTLPIIGGEVIIQLKATPLVATITIIDTYAIFSNIRLETYIVYEPLLMMTLIYLILAGAITLIFTLFEKKYKHH